MNLLLRILLALHLCGLVIMAGTTVIDYVTFKTFCNLTDAGDHRAQGLLPLMERYGGLVRTGTAILILTGIGMFIIKSNWWEETWFKIKIALVLLLVLNGMFVGNTLGMKFRKLITDGGMLSQAVTKVSTNLNRFYLLQLLLFLLIIIISAIRPGQHAIR